jgi:uncharacterized protein (TIGR03083 family)
VVDRVTKQQLLRTIRADRAGFESVIARVPEDQLAEPILPGGWSIKDVLAHIAWGEREGIGVMEARALVGSELWEVSEDERNEAVVSESRDRATQDVMKAYQSTFADYVAALERLSDEDLNEADRFVGLPERIPGWRPWRVLYDPTHYREHGETIQAAVTRLGLGQ